MTDTILVTGSSGKTGRRLAQILEQQSVTVRKASRQHGKDNVVFDWQDATTYETTLSKVDGVYLIPPAMIEDATPMVGPFLAMAKSSGVKRLVLVSSMGAAFPAEPAGSGRCRLEAQVRESSIEWTILRPSGFMQNFSEGFLLPAVRNGMIPNPAGGGKIAMVDAGDIAAVAASVLTAGNTHAGQVYDITGPSALGFIEIAEIIGREAQRSVQPRPMSSAQFLEMLEGAGVPGDYAAMLLRDQEAIRDGVASAVSDTVPSLLGRPARSFADFAAQTADAWR